MTAHVSRNETPVVTWPASTDPIEVLDWATRRFGDRITLSTSMGPQTLVVLDMVAALGREVPAFVLDTGYLFPETYALWERVQKRYGIRIDGVRATAPQRAEAALWKTNPDRC